MASKESSANQTIPSHLKVSLPGAVSVDGGWRKDDVKLEFGADIVAYHAAQRSFCETGAVTVKDIEPSSFFGQ